MNCFIKSDLQEKGVWEVLVDEFRTHLLGGLNERALNRFEP